MPQQQALGEFFAARLEIGDLLSSARDAAKASTALLPSARMSAEENRLRSVVVALVGTLQAYISGRLEEAADKLGSSWEALSDAERRYVGVHTYRRLHWVLSETEEGHLADIKKLERFKFEVEECVAWYSDPSQLANSKHRQSLQGFLKNNGSKVVGDVISRLGANDLQFFDWLSANHPRYRGASDRLDSIIAIRNDVAHGEFSIRVTMRDVRVYRVLIYRLIRKIDEYLQYPQ